MISQLKRWTPFTFFAPNRYVERGPYWRTFDLRQWSWDQYEWVSDGWNGYRDIAQEPRETVKTNQGDCEDYALVAASWAVSQDGDVGFTAEREWVRLGYCWEEGKPHPTHAICYDDIAVYSSGYIGVMSPEEWLKESPYSYIIGRLVK